MDTNAPVFSFETDASIVDKKNLQEKIDIFDLDN